MSNIVLRSDNSMFRKRAKKSGKNLRRKRSDGDEHNKEGDGDGDDATGIAIRKTMKKHKILASLPLTSVGMTPKGIIKNESRDGGEQSSSDQMISQATTAATPSSGELSVLATKHMSNMEAFIEQQMEVTRSASSASNGNEKREEKNAPSGSEQKTGNNTDIISTEEDLYQQLAREITNGDNNSGVNNNNQKSQQQAQQDGDQGDGGAALLVGTGIAEVILPATNHRPVAAPTSNRVWNKNSNSLSSAVPEGERHKHRLPNTTPKPFVKFRKNNNTLPQNNDNNPNNSNNEDGKGLNIIQRSIEQTSASSSTTRKGFDAFRGKISASDCSNEGDNGNQNRYLNQNNKRKTGKDRDDQVYSHFLKNALNGKNRR